MSLDVKRYPILVVDDEQDNLDAFRFNFRKTFDILTASSGPDETETDEPMRRTASIPTYAAAPSISSTVRPEAKTSAR